MTRIGIISDTHGVLDPRVARAFDGVSHILHAGDIGSNLILDELGVIAPVVAVLGNCDRADYGPTVEGFAFTNISGATFSITHQPRYLRLSDRADVYVFGHTHIPLIQRKDMRGRSVLLVNPGSATRPRANGGPSVAVIEVDAGRIGGSAIIYLDEMT